ncbi:lipoprotein [Streptomyces blastmyceticus]|uniref:Lipoprotein n=1 Tax=Streptomyces blastmyceticus TaxID=68180 RepID=A0ABN0XWA7_9ACTN
MRARGAAWAAVCVAFAFGALSGCTSSSEASKPTAPSKAGASGDLWGDRSGTADGQEALGGKGSPCQLPVTFRLAQSWKPNSVDSSPASGGPVRQGPVQLVCEIDAKPAGSVGFMRVWSDTSSAMDARKALESFVAAEPRAKEPEYRETKAGTLPATEVTYLNDAPGLTEAKRERALAVKTPQGVVVLYLGGLDTAEHERMLPAYQLAKKSMAPAN